MAMEICNRQNMAHQYDGYKISPEMREHINAEKSSSNVHKDRDTVNFSAEGRNMCYGFGVPDIKDRAKNTVVKPGIAPIFDTVSRTLKAVREEKENAVSGKQNNAELNLSDKAKKLLEELRKEFGDMEFFVLGAGSDAKSLLAGSTKEFSVLFSAEELEKMASDEKYKKERINGIQGAVRMSEAINEKYGYERAFGRQNNDVAISKIAISFNEDGSTTMFAELEKMSKQQRENIEAAREKRAVEKKVAEKKAAQKESAPVKRAIVSAFSMDELIDKINEVDWSKVKEESNVGSRFDFFA